MSFHKIQMPSAAVPHYATIRDKIRSSGLTSIRWVTKSVVVAADFACKKLYCLEIKGNDYEVLSVIDTVISNGTAVETDLLDYKDGLVVTTNFYQGSLSFYEHEASNLKFLKEVSFNSFVGAHGVRFDPKYEDLIWVSYCGVNNKCFQLINYKTEEVIHTVPIDEQAQDVAFVDDYIVVFARTDHISKGARKKRFWKPLKKMYASAFVYKLPEDLLINPPTLVSSWKGKGHIDATKEHHGLIYAANQYDNTVDVFSIKDEKLNLVRRISGFAMPHGLDLNQSSNMVVTNYADNTLILLNVNELVLDCPRILKPIASFLPALFKRFKGSKA